MDTLQDRIVAVLRGQPGICYCDGCLALQVKATLAEAQAVVAGFEGDAHFTVRQDTCSSCRRRKVVVCTGAPVPPSP